MDDDRRLDEVILDPGLRAHARRARGEALPVLVQVRGERPRVEIGERGPGRSDAPARRPVRVSVPDPATARADRERLERVAGELGERSGDPAPTVLRAAHALAIRLDPAGLRAAAELDEVEAIVPDRRHELE